MNRAVTVAEAAREFRCSDRTVRRWLSEGCPVAAQGGAGRGKGARLELEAVRAWREAKDAKGHEATLRELAELTLDFYRRGCEAGFAGQRMFGVPNHKAAALLRFLLHYFATRLIGAELRTTETDLLEAIAQQGVGNGHAMSDLIKGEQSTERKGSCSTTTK